MRHVVTQVFKQKLDSPLAKVLIQNDILNIPTLFSLDEQSLTQLYWTNEHGEMKPILIAHVRLIVLFKSYVIDQILPVSTLSEENDWFAINATDFNMYRIWGPSPLIGSSQQTSPFGMPTSNALRDFRLRQLMSRSKI